MSAPSSPPDLGAAWLAAARNDGIALELESVYEYIGAAIESRGPACWASGRCCNFEATGHRLYVTGLEAAYTVSRLDPGGTGVPPVILSTTSLSAALVRGGCPFQAANLCGVHTIKPLGCRVYFCDRSAQAWQQALSERALAMVRAIHDRYAIEYRYGEWRQMLGYYTLESRV